MAEIDEPLHEALSVSIDQTAEVPETRANREVVDWIVRELVYKRTVVLDGELQVYYVN